MLELRGNTIFVDEPWQLAEERPNIEVGALAVRVGAGDPPPNLREFFDFSLSVGAETFGPFRAEVVHQMGATIGLHLDDKAMAGLLTVCEHVQAVSSTGRPSLPRASQPALEAITATLEPQLVVSGLLHGRVSPGVLVDLLDEGLPLTTPPERTSLVRLLRFLASQRATGSLVIKGQKHKKTVWLRQGVPLGVMCDPPKEDEMLGQILLKVRWISPQQLAGALRWGKTDNTPLGATMVRTGLLEEKKLQRALVHQTYRRLRDLFNWEGARYELLPEEEQPSGQTPLPVHRLLPEIALDVLRDATLADLSLLTQHHSSSYPSLDPSLSAERFKLLVPEDKTRRVCEQIFNGARPLQLAIKSSVLGRQRTTRLVLYLLAARALKMTIDPKDRMLSAKEQLSERERTLEVQDAYQRLGLRYRSHADEFSEAHKRRSADFVAGSPLHRANPKSAEKCMAMLAEAQMLLTNRASRQQYRKKILTKEKLAYFAKLAEDESTLAKLHGDSQRASRMAEVAQELRADK